jgi:leader peptidase (prepilin peptidase)/N-methyltransferase
MHSLFPVAAPAQGGWFDPGAHAFAMLPVAWQYAFAIVFGLVIGSFLTVVVHRLPVMLERAWREELAEFDSGTDAKADPKNDATTTAHHETHLSGNAAPFPHDTRPSPDAPLNARYNLWLPRSACTACGHTLRAYENIPLVSFILLRGRCSACGAKIGWRYPLIEAASAVFAALSLAAFGPTFAALAAFGFCAALLAMSAIDLATRLLPDSLTLPLLWAGLLINLNGTFATLDAAVIGAAAGYLSLWSVYWLFKLVRGVEGMGYGDFKLLAAIGAWLGWSALLQVILVASVSGAIVGVGATLAKRMRLEEPLPFGPFLALAGILTLFFGAPLYRLIGG